MSGIPYNIQEFKIIVDYLVQNKLYSEIKARKMWVDFANTKLTSRTWQSLKETFLKRILPDIHNPYFQLTNEQISSFRARCDLSDRNKNKLDIQTISDDSNSNGYNPKDNEPNKEGETSAGENTKCSKVPVRSRSSADTVILENCYETAEEIQKDLESNESDEKPSAATKSFRDCITYSEPLTPMLQEVLDDFASEPEDSDREGQMEIVENVPEENLEDMQEIPEPTNEIPNNKSVATDVAKNAKGLSAEMVEEVLAQELDGGSKPENKSPKKKNTNSTNEIEDLPEIGLNDDISSMQVENGTERVDDTQPESPETPKLVIAEDAEKPVVRNSGASDVIEITDSEPREQSGGLNNSNSTVDASLPNNPEGFNKKNSKDVADKVDSTKPPESVVEVKNNSDKTLSSKRTTRKRSCEDNSNTIDSKKKKLDIKLKSPAKADNKVTETHLETDDTTKANEKFLKPDVIKKPWLEENPVDTNKPSTSFETRVVDMIETEQKNNSKKSPEIKNPCLQNVSLFDEQYNKTKYNMSESSDTEQNKKETHTEKQEASRLKSPNEEVVDLRANTDSDSEEVHASPKKKQRTGLLTNKSERDRAISNMFGFTSGGGVGAKRKLQLNRRRRTISHNNVSHHTAGAQSNSSDWTSESASEEYVSPPRSRKNRPTRKYKKPHAARISSLAEEGGLFVMYGKKIYPIVKDGKIVKNYITYLPESESEEEGGAFWKSKYVEEKKKAAELKRLLEAKEELQMRDTNPPVPQVNTPKNSKSETPSAVAPSNGFGKEICVPVPEEKKDEPKVNPPEKIKIKFTRNNEEVHLEGHWPQIHPVLEQVVHIFHKESEPSVNENRSKMSVPHRESKELSSGGSTPVIITPVDPEVHEKVNEIEKEIFKEIEERDKEENVPNEQTTNVTTRKVGRPRKSSSSAHSPEKKPRVSNGQQTKEPEENGRTRKQKAKETENNNNTQEKQPKRQARTPRKVLNETVNIDESKTIQTRRSTQKLNSSVTNEDEDEEVRYMLPPQNNRRSLKSTSKKTSQKKSCALTPKVISSPDNISLNSIESTQGYQDSDVSLINTEARKKKKIDMSSFMIKTRNSLRRTTKRKSHPYAYHDAYNDSSSSSVDVSVKVVRENKENSSLNTEAYRSESYQLLNPQAKVSSRELEPIDEITPVDNETYFVRHLESICRDEISAQINNNRASPSCQMTSDVGSSSNVSLPMSPELSLVENLSISKDIINTADFPTLNEMQSNEIKETTMCSKYMISNVDVSVPLMNQELEFGSCNTVTDMSTEPKSLVTESLLKKIGIFNINDQVSASETLNEKLQYLHLESAKKTNDSQSKCAEKPVSMMDVDVTSATVQKKPKANKKRCSTPQKRKGSKKSVAPTVDPVVEEEHVESCSHSGRKSCPPLFQTNQADDNVVTEEINVANPNLTVANEKPKGRKKKDIIRVKIQRPKNKKASAKQRVKSAQDASKISVFTDSGINDSETELFAPANDSVDLIHNHSETCLHANECVGDSIEFVENSKSVISLGDSMQSGDNAWSSRCVDIGEHSTSPDLFCNNAQDVGAYNRAYSESVANTSETVYYSPLGTEASPTSLITEDLSNDTPPPPRSSKWYLLSEDETNTNLVGAGSTMLSGGNFGGSNLKQIFPIACAIPDLSTITEMSRENDSSRKPTLEDLNGLTGDDFNSLSVFDSNFSL